MGVEVVTVSEEEGEQRLDRWFKKRYPALGHGRLEKLLRTGQIRVDGKRAKANQRLETGQEVRIPPLGEEVTSGELPPERPKAAAQPKVVGTPDERQALENSVLLQDDHVIVLNKAPGLAVQGGTKTTTHVDAMLDQFTRNGIRPKLVHRLDKDTSGILVLARTTAAARHLTAAFRSRQTQKIYWAIVTGSPPLAAGTIRGAIDKAPGAGGERMEINEETGKPAVTDFRMLDRASKTCAWVELRPRTGRTHQLRVHCLAMGTPILGDGKYGGQDAFVDMPGLSRKLHLHARGLKIPHPNGGILEVVAPVPKHIADTLKLMGFVQREAPDPFAGWEDD